MLMCSLQCTGYPRAARSVAVAADKIRYRVRVPGSKDTKLLLVNCHLSAVNARKSFILPVAKPCSPSTSVLWLGCFVSLSEGNSVHCMEMIHFLQPSQAFAVSNQNN